MCTNSAERAGGALWDSAPLVPFSPIGATGVVLVVTLIEKPPCGWCLERCLTDASSSKIEVPPGLNPSVFEARLSGK